MKNSNNVTVTNARVISAMSPIIKSVVEPNIKKEIKKEVNTSKIHTGILTKYYPYLDKAEVKVDNKLILCKILHRVHGSLVDFFTPTGDSSFCEKLKEPCIIPQGELDCLIADINDNTKEQLLLGFFLKNDVLYTSPANPGHYKITNLGATNEWGLDIGDGNIKLDSSDGVTFTEGLVQKENTIVEYATSDNVYGKKEVYTKKEVDNAIKKAIDDLRNEILGDSSDTTS